MSNMHDNPYVGPHTFSQAQSHLFFGREREARDLLSLVIAERLVLFYAQSGAGKSSLINTRLIPGLQAEGFEVLPIGRVGSGLAPQVEVDNIFIYNLLLSLNQQTGESNASLDAKATLKDFLREHNFARTLDDNDQSPDFDNDAEIRPRVLIIDQFEEIFITHLNAWSKREAFFQQLHQALADDESLWVVLVIREDYLGALSPYVHLLPDKLRARYYMQRLEFNAAREAVEKPAALYGRPFAEETAVILINNLCRLHSEQNSLPTQASPQVGQYVEPIHLQIVCEQLWANLPPDRTAILAEDVEEFGDIDEALIDFYEATLQKVVAQTTLSERRLRAWVDTRLITPTRKRRLVQHGEVETEGLPNTAVDILCEARLIRTERRGQDTWYELSHDRLVEPIQESNTDWFEQNLNPLQRQADLWDKQGQPGELLLRDQILKEAEQWAKTNPDELSEIENKFLAACRQAQAATERERQQARRNRLLAIVATILSMIALTFLCCSVFLLYRVGTERDLADAARVHAEEQTQIARDRLFDRLAAQSRFVVNDQLDLGLLLSIEANAITGTHNLEARSSLLAGLESNPHLTGFLRGHTDSVNSVAFSPDGRLVASASDDHTIILWNVATQQPIGPPLTDQTNWVLSLAFNPKGDILASGNGDNKIILWDVTMRRPIGQLIGHTKPVQSLAFSPDGKILASGSRDNTIILWDVAKRQPITPTLEGHTDWVNSVTFSPDGRIIASGSGDEKIILWDVEKHRPIGKPLTGHTDNVRSVAFSHDGQILASGGNDNKVILWDVTKHQSIDSSLEGHTDWVQSVVFSPDDQILISASKDKTIILWEVESHRPFNQPLKAHTDSVRSLAFSSDGRTFASASGDNTVILWDVFGRQRMGQILAKHPAAIRSLAVSPDGQTWASGSSNGSITLWDAATGQERLTLPHLHTDSVNSVAFSPNGQQLVSGSDDKTVILWDVATGQPMDKPLTGYHSSWVNSVAFSPTGKAFASGGGDSLVILWTRDGNQLRRRRLTGHRDNIRSIAFSEDGKILASAGDDETIILWDVETGQRIGQPLTDHEDWVINLVFSPDGQTLASGSRDDTIILWDVATRQSIHRLKGHSNTVMSLAFSKDGQLLASGSWDHSIRLWNVVTGQPLGRPFTGHTSAVYNVFFSAPDNQTLLSGSLDGTIRQWDVVTGQPARLPITGPATQVNSIAFSPDGKTLASASDDGSIILWSVNDGERPSSVLTENNGSITSLGFFSNGQILIGGSNNGSILAWDVENGDSQPLSGHTARVNSVAVTKDKLVWASGSNDQEIILWKFEDNQVISQTLSMHTDIVNSVVFSPDDQTLASGSDDKTVILWDVNKGQAIGQSLTGHTGQVKSVAFSPDGQTLASGDSENSIILWDVATRQSKGPSLLGHTKPVRSLAFSPDGAILASSSDDDTIILWDVATGRMLGSLKGHSAAVQSVAFSPDGNTLASSGQDGLIILWDISFKNWQTLACQTAGRNFTWPEWKQFFGDDPYHKTCPSLPVHFSTVEAAQELALAGQMETGLAQFQYLLELDPSLVSNANFFYRRGETYARLGNYEQARADYNEAIELDPDNPDHYNSICWFGSLLGHAAEVMDACDQAIKLAPNDGQIYDSRGVARVLTQNYPGAIKDFESFIKWSEQAERRDELRSERESWIAALKDGQNPFDKQTLQRLLKTQ